jgi:hypothetical protein
MVFSFYPTDKHDEFEQPVEKINLAVVYILDRQG